MTISKTGLIISSFFVVVLNAQNRFIEFQDILEFVKRTQLEDDSETPILRFAREIPKPYIDKAIKLFKERQGKTIVEIGASRFYFKHDLDTQTCPYCMDGHSTMLWARTKAQVYSVDIDDKTIELTKKLCKDCNNVHAYVQDGIEFLKNFNQPIDLLYLDAWDVIPGTNYAEKHLEAYQVAKSKLHDASLILIDDTDIYDGGKGRLVIPRAVSDGFKVVFFGRQTLLAKK